MDQTTAASAAVAPTSQGHAMGEPYDEARFPNGEPRPAWKGFLESLSTLSSADLASRQDTANRLLREHGATYTIYDDPQSADRHWKLDILPLIIGAEEWNSLEAGLKQRSRLLRMVVKDLYSDRRLMKEGWIPPSMLFANPGFLRAAHGIKPPGGSFLFHHAVDLARGTNGKWMVLADRTQAPSGKGYTLENRVVLTSIFTEQFRDLHVQRLASFFQIERDGLRALAPQHKSDPTIVLLSPGPLNETYFEHAYKARYLGFPLVEGADLTVRDSKVFLKTLEGLRQVDVIVRRVDDTFCDPLELRSETWLGVSGLMEAWRRGTVAIANGLGSGIVETPALMPFLPGLCKHLLSEELILANAVTWWCGQPKELAQVEANLDGYVIKRAFVGGAGEPVFGDHVSQGQREGLLARIHAFPQGYAAQQLLNLSTAPVFDGGRLEQRPLVLRCYIVPNGDSFAVLPGGLTRVSPSPQGLVVSMQSGGISKDTWVLSDAPVEQLTLFLPPTASARPERLPGEVPSRVADHFFWLGRYAERLEDAVRVLRAVLSRLVGEGSEEQTRELQALVPWLVELERLPEKFADCVPRSHLVAELTSLIEDPTRSGSVPDLIGRMRFNALALRDRLSDDTWRICNQIDRDAGRRPVRIGASLPDKLGVLNAMVLNLAAFAGMEMENMTRGHGWRFLDLGRRLERSSNLLSLLKAAVHPPALDQALLSPILEICDSAMTYRRRYHSRPQLAPLLDLLMADESNPRSLMWQLQQLARHVGQLPRDGQEGASGSEKIQVDALLSSLSSTHFTSLATSEELAPGNLTAICDELSAGLKHLSDTVTQHYFAQVLPRVR